MNYFGLIKEYQGLVGTFAGAFLAIISSIFLWSLKQWIEGRKEIKNNKNEIEKIFLTALRECDDSVNNMAYYLEEFGKIINLNEKSFNLVLPPKFNRIYINEDRLIALSKNLHHIISQQIDIASSAVKKFNGWLEQYEKMPEFIFNANLKILETGLKPKNDVIEEYHNDLKMYKKGILRIVNERAPIIKLHLLRPVSAQQYKIRKLEKLFYSNQLEKTLDSFSSYYIKHNELPEKDFFFKKHLILCRVLLS